MKAFLLIASFCILQALANKTMTAYNYGCLDFQNKMKASHGSFFGDNKCVGETYRFGHQLEKFQDECSVEPQDENMSYEDCVWTFYKCVVQKSLGDLPLTLTNYAEMMSSTLSETVKAAIFTSLQLNANNNQSEPLTSEEERDSESNSTMPQELEDISTYWRQYFDAEFQVCMDTPNNTCDRSKTEKNDMLLRQVRNVYEPAQNCKNGKVPNYRNRDRFPTPLSTRQMNACAKSFNESHTVSNWTAQAKYSLGAVCLLITERRLNQGDNNLNTLVDFQSIFKKEISPEFYSKAVKEHIFTSLRSWFSIKYPSKKEDISKSESVEEIFSYAVQHMEVKLKEQEPKTDNWMFLTNTEIIHDLFAAESHALYNLCGMMRRKSWPKSSRKQIRTKNL